MSTRTVRSLSTHLLSVCSAPGAVRFRAPTLNTRYQLCHLGLKSLEEGEDERTGVQPGVVSAGIEELLRT